MMRALALLARRPDLDRAAFRHHYETRHAPLAEPLLDGLVHYVRNHVVAELAGGPVAFDALSEFGYADREDFLRVGELLASPRGQVLHEDELRFMDRSRNLHFGLEPRGGDVGGPSPRRVAMLSRGAGGAARPGFLEALDRLLGPHLATGSGNAHFGTTALGAPPPWDAASFLRLEDGEEARRLHAEVVALGGRACLVAVESRASRHHPGWGG